MTDRAATGARLGWLALAALVLWSAWWIAPEQAEGANRIAAIDILSESWPPDMSAVADAWPTLLDTIAMAVVATVMATVLALPLSCLAASSLGAPAPVRWVLRSFFAGLRAIPDLMLGLLFVLVLGFGPIAGVVALAVHSLGMLGKFFADAFEEVPSTLLELGESVGADRMATASRIALPSALPRLAGYVTYRVEHNLRAAVVLGAVGAGGIGEEVFVAARTFDYDRTAALVLTVAIMVLATEALGVIVRRKLR